MGVPILHGEIAAVNDDVAHHGDQDWPAHLLCTTGEPRSMCMSAWFERGFAT
jgi:tRNA(Arg) A34 adenosine deaminase TadA